MSSVVAGGLAAHLATFGACPVGWCPHAAGWGGPAQASRYARRAGMASGLSKGVSRALVAERLGHGHKTLPRTYAHVIRQDDERVRAIVGVTLAGDAEDLSTEVV